MDKVDIIRKHIGNDDFYDMNGTPLLTKILAAMDEYAQQQVKNCSIPDVSGSAEADYWSNRCKLVEDIWENTPSGDHIEELAELEQDYHKFIKENGGRHYR